MKRKKGDLPGRYVPPHIRRAPNRPSDYVNVSEYQERVDPTPSPLQPLQVQGELDLTEQEEPSKDNDECRANSPATTASGIRPRTNPHP